ncbi:hypothetical protein F511_23916 [Dorcoceras hygrometricum]|uniref:Uncharacterized protein n=1 Tax=Dorcoceras hygrometricum TaxID=472368 RepID=A0A2Z7BFS4_9LAMI|nr:hypothetical protein F511_23916 [Dorcoceras hygrometricum]
MGDIGVGKKIVEHTLCQTRLTEVSAGASCPMWPMLILDVEAYWSRRFDSVHKEPSTRHQDYKIINSTSKMLYFILNLSRTPTHRNTGLNNIILMVLSPRFLYNLFPTLPLLLGAIYETPRL